MLRRMTGSSGPAGAGRPSCANCGALLNGPYCAQCGQDERDVAAIPLRRLVADAFGDVFSFDSRVFRTLRPLVRRPGLLTVEYLAGRRARYVPPFRLYIFVSLVMFIVLGLTGPQWNFVVTGEGGKTIVSTEAAPGAGAEDGEAIESGENAERSADIGRNTAEVSQRLLDRLPQVMIALVPVFGAFVWLANKRRHRLYVPHLVFALHVFSFWFLAWASASLLDLAFAPRGPAKATALAVNAAYLYLAQRRAYGGSRFANLARTVGLCLAQALALFAAMWLLLILTVWRL